MGLFSFLKPKYYKGEVVDLKEKYRVDEKEAYDGVPCVYYDIYTSDNHKKVGTIDLRLTVDGDNYYYGHIGYTIIESQRGHHYAYYACKVLFEIAATEFNMSELIITCSPENIASYKTLEKLGGQLLEKVTLPKKHPMYLFGEKEKYIFKYNIKN